MPGRVVASLTNYYETKNIFLNIPAVKNIIQWVFACEKFGSNTAMKNIFVVIEEKESIKAVL